MTGPFSAGEPNAPAAPPPWGYPRFVDILTVREMTGKGVRVEFVKESLTFTEEDSAMDTLLLSMLGWSSRHTTAQTTSMLS